MTPSNNCYCDGCLVVYQKSSLLCIYMFLLDQNQMALNIKYCKLCLKHGLLFFSYVLHMYCVTVYILGTNPEYIQNIQIILLMQIFLLFFKQPWQSEEEGSWLREYPITLMQFFRYLYHNITDLAPMWHSADFLCTLAAAVFPFNIRPYSEMVRKVVLFLTAQQSLDINVVKVCVQKVGGINCGASCFLR